MLMNLSHLNSMPVMKPSDRLHRSQQRRLKRKFLYAALLLSALLLMSLVQGCASQQPVPCKPPLKIPQPALREPPPSESYLTTASKRILEWQKTLIDTLPIQ